MSLINIIKRKEKLVKYVALFTLYKVLIELTYVVAVSHWYSYLGFVYSPNLVKCAFSYFSFFLLVCMLERRININGVILNTYFSISTVPMLSFYWLADKETRYLILIILFFMIFNGVSKFNPKKIAFTLGYSFRNYDFIITIIFVCYIVTSVLLGIIRGGIDFRALSLSTIYNLRDEGSSLGTIGGYILNWCAKAFFPMFTVYYLYKKQFLRVVVCLLCQLFLFLCYGFKAYLLSVLLTVVVYFLGRRAVVNNQESNIGNIVVFIAGLVPAFLSRVSGLIGKIGFAINNIYAMRMLFEPARIANGYFGFFSDNDKLYFSEGLVGKLFGLEYPYNEPIGFIITRYMNGAQAVSNSNTGIVADSYSQMGVIGIIVIAILAGLIVLLIKKVSINIPCYFVAAAFFYPTFMLNDNPLLTNLLTNGWMVNILLLALFSNALRTSQPSKLESKSRLTNAYQPASRSVIDE